MTPYRTISDDVVPLYVGWDELTQSYWADTDPFALAKQHELLIRARAQYRTVDANLAQMGARSEWILERGPIDTLHDLMVQTWDVVSWAANHELLWELLMDPLEAHRSRLFDMADEWSQRPDVDRKLANLAREALSGWNDEDLSYPLAPTECIDLPKKNRSVLINWNLELETYHIVLIEVLAEDPAHPFENIRALHEVGDSPLDVSNLTELISLMSDTIDWHKQSRERLVRLRNLPLALKAFWLEYSNLADPGDESDPPELRALLDAVLDDWSAFHEPKRPDVTPQVAE